jgi:AcrR family transcriptional regulator
LYKDQILAAALELAESIGYAHVLKRHIAKKLKIGMGTVNSNWGTMEALRYEVVREAIRTTNTTVMLQAIAARHPLTIRMSLEKRAAALSA